MASCGSENAFAILCIKHLQLFSWLVLIVSPALNCDADPAEEVKDTPDEDNQPLGRTTCFKYNVQVLDSASKTVINLRRLIPYLGVPLHHSTINLVGASQFNLSRDWRWLESMNRAYDLGGFLANTQSDKDPVPHCQDNVF
ncbi:hypothetical protein BDK51DRAFT_27753 [Blyttiomyces helicus]|uniref:Uncharacterized protein n=1 Tax=Blyttiomyces helicus TaxID=388810 RepID=A0A4P9WQB8_9FUNG|nr:hypothetical protein BDK51DRAFT_27753 [Blyttiomyces helicus]|eukprot:RKO93998.1 hypothetical protein BDK51DRAFT_27753 [Blyttiomyces helicus]